MRTKRITAEDVLTAVSIVTAVDRKDIASKCRHPSVVAARTVYAALSRKHTVDSGPVRADVMGKRNHSTIFTAEKRFEERMANNTIAYRASNGRLVRYPEIARVVEELLGVRDPQAVCA